MSAPMTPFEEWWKGKLAEGMEKSGTVPAVSVQEAFEAGYRSALAWDTEPEPEIDPWGRLIFSVAGGAR